MINNYSRSKFAKELCDILILIEKCNLPFISIVIKDHPYILCKIEIQVKYKDKLLELDSIKTKYLLMNTAIRIVNYVNLVVVLYYIKSNEKE